MEAHFSHSAFRELRKFPKPLQERIVNKLEFYLSQEKPLEFAEKLTDREVGEWRFRVGEYRVVFDVTGGMIEVLKVGHRKDVYK